MLLTSFPQPCDGQTCLPNARVVLQVHVNARGVVASWHQGPTEFGFFPGFSCDTSRLAHFNFSEFA